MIERVVRLFNMWKNIHTFNGRDFFTCLGYFMMKIELIERTEILVNSAVSVAVKSMAKKRIICMNFASAIFYLENLFCLNHSH